MNVDMDGCYFSTMRSSGGEKKKKEEMYENGSGKEN